MEFVIGAAIVVVICVIGLQGISLHQAQQANGDLERQLKRRERDLAEARLKTDSLRKELATYPLAYTKPTLGERQWAALDRALVNRRREDLQPVIKPQGWDDSWGDQ